MFAGVRAYAIWLFLISELLVFCRSAKILCLVTTMPKNLNTRAIAVNETWGRRCDKLWFVTDLPYHELTYAENNIIKQLPIAPISGIKKGYEHLTMKVTFGFLFAYEYHYEQFDWFVKADDDTYLLVDNLRYFLSDKNSSEATTYGFNFKLFVQQGYHSGGASYVLSREALKLFYQGHHSEDKIYCAEDGGSEDVAVARCLRRKGVVPGKSLDEYGRELFHPLPFTYHFLGKFPNWTYSFFENRPKSGFECCGERSISFHYASPSDLYLLEYLYLSNREEENDHVPFISKRSH